MSVTRQGTTMTRARLVVDGGETGAAVRHTLETHTYTLSQKHTQECRVGTAQMPSLRVASGVYVGTGLSPDTRGMSEYV